MTDLTNGGKSYITCKTDKLDRMGEEYINFLCVCFLHNIKDNTPFDIFIQFFNEPFGETGRETKIPNAHLGMNVRDFKEMLTNLLSFYRGN